MRPRRRSLRGGSRWAVRVTCAPFGHATWVRAASVRSRERAEGELVEAAVLVSRKRTVGRVAAAAVTIGCVAP